MTSHRPASATARRETIQIASAAVGAVFLLVGVLGFAPGVVTDHETLEFAGHESEAELLGLFQVSVLHNIVHLLFGLAGLGLSRSIRGAQAFLIGGGVVYLILFIYGLAVDQRSDANFVPVNDADNWLHLFLAAAMVALGLVLNPRRSDATAAAGPTPPR